MKPITSFGLEYKFLSNFYPCSIRWCGILFDTAEHAYQAEKTLDVHERMSIALQSTPGRAKRAGQKVTIRPDWEHIKVETMEAIVTVKFRQNPSIMNMLISTDDADLIEGNLHHDNFWGNCICNKCRNIEGLNHLGKILMKVRELERKGIQ